MNSTIFINDIRRAELPHHYYVDMVFDGQEETYLFEVDDEYNSITPRDRRYTVRFHLTGRIANEAPALVGRFHRGEPLAFPIRILG